MLNSWFSKPRKEQEEEELKGYHTISLRIEQAQSHPYNIEASSVTSVHSPVEVYDRLRKQTLDSNFR